MTFESTTVRTFAIHRTKRNLDFGDALNNLKRGLRLSRVAWKGTGTHILYCYALERDVTRDVTRDGMKCTTTPSITLAKRGAGNTFIDTAWVPTHTDLLAQDWFVLECHEVTDFKNDDNYS
jgi:Protein of unknown function (DUF2829)